MGSQKDSRRRINGWQLDVKRIAGKITIDSDIASNHFCTRKFSFLPFFGYYLFFHFWSFFVKSKEGNIFAHAKFSSSLDFIKHENQDLKTGCVQKEEVKIIKEHMRTSGYINI